MNPAMVSVAGSSSPHNNLMPYLVLNYCIALQGIFPPRS
jgi:microcystin-dependent protein